MQVISESIDIRSLQHYLYCPHRWGLIEIGDCWAENYFVVKANIIHKRVHSTNSSYTSRGKTVLTSVTVWNDSPEYNLYGVTDCIELTSDDNGVEYNGKKFHFKIVEYKPTKPDGKDYNFEDALQVFAQKKCVDYVFNCNCDASIYYSDTKKSVDLPFAEKLEEFERALKNTISSIRYYTNVGVIPSIQKGQKCSGCSFQDLCLPRIKEVNSVFSNVIKSIQKNE